MPNISHKEIEDKLKAGIVVKNKDGSIRKKTGPEKGRLGIPNIPPGIRHGPMSKKDGELIGEYLALGMSTYDIAKQLKRQENAVINYARRYFGYGKELPVKAAERAEYVRELHQRTEWKFLKEHYNTEELSYFEEVYSKLMVQFKDDVMASEEFQIFTAIDCLLIINRNKKIRKQADDRMQELFRLIEQEKLKEDPNHPKIIQWEDERTHLNRLFNEKTKEFTELRKNFDNLLDELKATRRQRINNVENSDISWVGKIKNLQDRRVRDKEGRQIELRRIAMEQAEEKLKSPHQYVNGEWDQPLLCSDDIRIEHGEKE